MRLRCLTDVSIVARSLREVKEKRKGKFEITGEVGLVSSVVDEGSSTNLDLPTPPPPSRVSLSSSSELDGRPPRHSLRQSRLERPPNQPPALRRLHRRRRSLPLSLRGRALCRRGGVHCGRAAPTPLTASAGRIGVARRRL